MIASIRRTLAVCLLLALAACGSGPEQAASVASPRLETHTIGSGGSGGAGNGRAWDGVIEAVRHADLSAQTNGRVTVAAVDVDHRVRAGDVLLRLTTTEQQAGADAARAQLRAAEANAAEAQANYARFAALGAKQYVSRLQLDQARAARDAAVAARDAARAQLAQAGQQNDYTVVRAPFDGVVSARRVEPGESVSVGQPLLSLYAPGELRIEVDVPQREGEAIRSIDRATVLLADGRRIEATAILVFPAADPVTQSVRVRVALPATTDAPLPGTSAKVVFPIGDGAQVRVPRTAVVQRGEVSGVYVLEGPRISLRQIRIGQRLGDQVEVLAGLKSGDVVAADPVAALQALQAQRRAAGVAHE